jgi:hypothetical protein
MSTINRKFCVVRVSAANGEFLSVEHICDTYEEACEKCGEDNTIEEFIVWSVVE